MQQADNVNFDIGLTSDSPEIYDLWICSIPGFYSDSQAAVVKYFGSAKEAFFAKESEYDGWRKLGRAWVEKLLSSRNSTFIQEQIRKLEENHVRFIARSAPEYPSKLTHISEAPLGLFVRGRLPDPEVPGAAVVGARECSPYGRAMAGRIAERLVRSGVQVISGMARGIDGEGQRVAVRFENRSFAILGCGADVCYPMSNVDLYEDLVRRGGVISEFPCGTKPLKIHFPMRNRLISGLADFVVVVEARQRSGSLITAEYAIDQGKDVYAVPGRTDDPLSRGCNHLIADGAYLIEDENELIRILTERFSLVPEKSGRTAALAPSEKLVYSSLNFSAKSTDTLLRETGMAPGPLSEVLLQLEMRGLICEIGRNIYAKK